MDTRQAAFRTPGGAHLLPPSSLIWLPDSTLLPAYSPRRALLQTARVRLPKPSGMASASGSAQTIGTRLQAGGVDGAQAGNGCAGFVVPALAATGDVQAPQGRVLLVGFSWPAAGQPNALSHPGRFTPSIRTFGRAPAPL